MADNDKATSYLLYLLTMGVGGGGGGRKGIKIIPYQEKSQSQNQRSNERQYIKRSFLPTQLLKNNSKRAICTFVFPTILTTLPCEPFHFSI
jgi:hypothetical protein